MGKGAGHWLELEAEFNQLTERAQTDPAARPALPQAAPHRDETRPDSAAGTEKRKTKVWTMTALELDNLGSRFRFAEASVGVLGCLFVGYAVWAPCWLGDRGLWSPGNSSEPDTDWTGGIIIKALEAERVFAVLSFLMALGSGALCLVFACCWTSRTVQSYSNTRSLLMAGQALYPTTLMLITLTATGFFFLLCWSLFTRQHWAEISADPGQLGSSYWLGAFGWALLLGVLPAVFLVEQCVVPDPLPALMKAAEAWWRGGATLPYDCRSFSEGHCQRDQAITRGEKRYMSLP
ncbi:hypothetical protein AAFF_G00282230 [Aldrovandia affinis]|uniref:Transmembrane protein n=1 Tax=Aldrovandia affinis TaxID=143900 RepID=A0AAD7X0X8_9TELE|nr:hypothetical protein AAFF_G00282230 [Aldrovandia affinis]